VKSNEYTSTPRSSSRCDSAPSNKLQSTYP
jgi:hypothetical protein